MVNIVHILLGKANPNRPNGVNNVVNQLALTQTRMGVDVEVWGITPDPETPTTEREYAIQLFRAYQNKFRLDSKLVSKLKNARPGTTFHLHGGFIPTYFALHRQLVRLNLDYVFTPHGSYNKAALAKSRWQKAAYFRCFEKSLVSNAKALHLIGQSEFIAANDLPALSNKVLVPNGQNLEDLSFSYQSIRKSEEPIFSFCGRLKSKVKGLDYLLDGFADYYAESKMGYLWLIGDGQDRNALEQRASELGIKDRVVFWGGQFGAEKLNLLANSDAFFHPSRYEGLPTSVLEASGLGLPVAVSVATNLSKAIHESEAGLVLAPNSRVGVSKACHEFALAKQNGNLEKWGKNGKMMIRDQFSWQQVATELMDVYSA